MRQLKKWLGWTKGTKQDSPRDPRAFQRGVVSRKAPYLREWGNCMSGLLLILSLEQLMPSLAFNDMSLPPVEKQVGSLHL